MLWLEKIYDSGSTAALNSNSLFCFLSRVSSPHQVKHCEPPTPSPSCLLTSSLLSLETSPNTPKSLNPTRPHLPNAIQLLQLVPPLPHGGPKACTLTAIGCPGLFGARTPLAPPASPAPGEREGLRWCEHRRSPLGLLPTPGDGGGGRRGGR